MTLELRMLVSRVREKARKQGEMMFREWFKKRKKLKPLNELLVEIEEKWKDMMTPEEKLMHLTKWRQMAEADEKEMRVQNIINTMQQLTPQQRLISIENWHKKNYLGKPIKEGSMDELENVYKVVRKTHEPHIFESALIGVCDGNSRIVYPIGQIISDELDGIGIFCYKTYGDALEYTHWLESHELHLGQIVIMKAKGNIINDNLGENPIVVGMVGRSDGIIHLDNNVISTDEIFVLCDKLAIIMPAPEDEVAYWTKWEKESEPTYRRGDIIIIDEDDYLLASVDIKMMNLINLEDGNRWSDSKEVLNVNKVTHKELDGLVNQSGSEWKWHKKG